MTSLAAPLQLPVGSVIHSVTWHYRDQSVANLTLDLGQKNLVSGSVGVVGPFQLVSSGNVNGFLSGTRTFDYPVSAGTGLWLTAYSADWITAGSDLSIVGALVEYTLP